MLAQLRMPADYENLRLATGQGMEWAKKQQHKFDFLGPFGRTSVGD